MKQFTDYCHCSGPWIIHALCGRDNVYGHYSTWLKWAHQIIGLRLEFSALDALDSSQVLLLRRVQCIGLNARWHMLSSQQVQCTRVLDWISSVTNHYWYTKGKNYITKLKNVKFRSSWCSNTSSKSSLPLHHFMLHNLVIWFINQTISPSRAINSFLCQKFSAFKHLGWSYGFRNYQNQYTHAQAACWSHKNSANCTVCLVGKKH